MAKITDLVILNPSDHTRHFAVCMGKGAPADADDTLVTNVKDFPIGSQFTDLTNKKFYVRMEADKAVADWSLIGPAN